MYLRWHSLVLLLACVPNVPSMDASDLPHLPDIVKKPPRMSDIIASMNSVGKGTQAEYGDAQQCGVVGIMVGGHQKNTYFNGTLDDSKCSTLLLTNCSESYASDCPSSCQYRAVHPIFPCMFTCVGQDNCSQIDAERTYAMPEIGMCTQCKMPLCKLCVKDASGKHKCRECYDQFELQEDGTCIFYMDKYMPDPNKFLLALVIIVVVIVVFSIIWSCFNGQHPHRQRHMQAIIRGRRHRHLTKTTRWHLKREQAREWINTFANVHTGDFFGLGAALFYNGIIFLFVVSLICWMAVKSLYQNNLHGALVTTDMAMETIYERARMMPQGQPAVIISPLHDCGHTNPESSHELFLQFAKKKCVVCGFLYIVVLLLSLAFAKFQKFWDENFDRRHASMTDYVIWVDGLSKEDTDEGELRDWFELEFRKWIPEAQSRSSNVQGDFEIHRERSPTQMSAITLDEEEQVEDSQIEVFGVSVCYDYFKQRDEVDDSLWKMMEITEVHIDGTLTVEDTQVAGQGKTLDMWETEEYKRVEEFFKEGDKKLKGTGQAFVVFMYMTDRDNIYEAYKKGKRLTRDGKELVFSLPVMDPPNVQWWYFGLEESERKQRMLKFAGKLALLVLCIQGCVTLPYTYFVLWPYSSTGTTASGVKVTIAGMILGNTNWICFLSNYLTAEQIGYRTKDWLYIFVLVSNTVVVAVLTVCNIGTAAHFITHQYRIAVGPKDYFEMALSSIGHEAAFSKNVYNICMPGGFFVGMVMCAIMAGPVPYTVTTIFSKVIYVWRCMPTCVLKILKAFLPWSPPTVDYYPARSAEKGLEPWEVPICGNYADHVVTPSLCFFMLFFLSPHSYEILQGMMFWAVFEYAYFRWMHLRYHKTCYYQSPRLDVFFCYMWGIPLSIIGAACSCWALRAQMIFQNSHYVLKMTIICAVFCVSALIWVIMLTCFVQPWSRRDVQDDRKDRSVLQVEEHSIYSWLNCNPVFALKCRYFFQDRDRREDKSRTKKHPMSVNKDGHVLFYQIGKQYMFLAQRQRTMLFSKNLMSSLEWETWYEYMLSFGGYFRNRGRGTKGDDMEGQALLPIEGSTMTD